MVISPCLWCHYFPLNASNALDSVYTMAAVLPPPASAMSQRRRLSSRRGSISAHDPLGAHSQVNFNPSRSSSSTLTIVRVTSPPVSPQPISLREPPSSPSLNHRRNHRRNGSAGSVGSNSSQRPDAPGRVSFAFSSFSGNHSSGPAASPNSERSQSPNSSRTRPSSPSQSRHSQSFSNPRLSPDQLVDLARRSMNSPHTTPCQTPASQLSPDCSFQETVPASFTAMADDMWLPFIDRPVEVHALISCPPSAKLFTLLAQTFPHSDGKPSPKLSAIAAPHKEYTLKDFPADPTTWTFEQLYLWLTMVPRSVASDAAWVHGARACILVRSELIWERIKGALGVPPELDVDSTSDAETEYSDEHIVIGEWGSSMRRASPDTDDGMYESEQEDTLSLSIENIMSPSERDRPVVSSSLSHSPLMAETGLQDISEDQEETEGDDKNKTLMPGDYTNVKPVDVPLQRSSSTTSIQGLKISTTPMPSSPMIPATASPISYESRARSGASSPSHQMHPAHQESPLNRSFTITSSPTNAAFTRAKRTGSFGSIHSMQSNGSAAPYDPVGDRVPGNPIFPSNFARLAVGPTLRAK